MIEQLFNLIQQESQNEIANNTAIPNEQNNQAVGLATETIFSGLQGALANGGLKDVMGLFGGQAQASTANPLVGNITNNFVESLMKKFGIDSPIATSIAASLIPSILGKMVSKTNDPSNNGFDINNIIGALTGGNAQNSGVEIPGGPSNTSGGIDFGSILKTIASGGLDANKDGHIGLDDLSGLIGGAASNAQQQNQSQQEPQANGAGGIFDMLKGLMGN